MSAMAARRALYLWAIRFDKRHREEHDEQSVVCVPYERVQRDTGNQTSKHTRVLARKRAGGA